MKSDRLHRWSSVGRRLDIRYPTNRAVLYLLPIAGLIAAGFALWRGNEDRELLRFAIGGVATAFGGWALTRELSPDDNPAAFVSMALALATFMAISHTSILLLITTLMLARMINRSVGLPARILDSIAITGLVAWTAYANQSPLPAVVAAFAFALDASLAPTLPRQWILAGCCLGLGTVSVMFRPSVNSPPTETWVSWLLIAIVLSFGVMIARTRRMNSVADATGQPLTPHRVRAGMLVGLLMAASGFVLTPRGVARSALVWAILLGVVAGGMSRLARKKHLRTG